MRAAALNSYDDRRDKFRVAQETRLWTQIDLNPYRHLCGNAPKSSYGHLHDSAGMISS